MQYCRCLTDTARDRAPARSGRGTPPTNIVFLGSSAWEPSITKSESPRLHGRIWTWASIQQHTCRYHTWTYIYTNVRSCAWLCRYMYMYTHWHVVSPTSSKNTNCTCNRTTRALVNADWSIVIHEHVTQNICHFKSKACNKRILSCKPSHTSIFVWKVHSHMK